MGDNDGKNMNEISLAIERFNNGDYESSIETIMRYSQEGNELAEGSLGLAYQFGFGVQRDIHKALDLLQSAANKGYGCAAHNLGTLYLEPSVLNPEKSQYWYKKAQSLGFIVTQDEWYKDD